MADYRDLTGDYEVDFPLLKELLHSITTEMNVDNRQGQVIEHTFTTTSAETIAHDLGKTPTLWEAQDLEGSGTIYRDSWSATSISLVSSNSSQVLRFYVE